MMLTGTASIGMSVARQLWRKRNTTSVTRIIASTSVFDHFLHRRGDERRRVERNLVLHARREAFCSSSIRLDDLLHGPRAGWRRAGRRPGRTPSGAPLSRPTAS